LAGLTGNKFLTKNLFQQFFNMKTFTPSSSKNIGDPLALSVKSWCGGLEMAPHVNKWSPLDGAHKLQVTVIVTTGELS